ncbi:glyoxalase [Notoacmeibacter marinus]|uniref:Glyoxalase n=1 Tax=Notoacmeibacter marinus TaxID=1876515 RepID=A0A231UTD9_9HYPH|nr:VOC family protein [Notoacmeibacter marinus]OXS99169.1 glyoxalase [Notoacmeibacter marinus]
MKLWLHHINVVSHNVEELQDFYGDVLGLQRQTEDIPVRSDGYSAPVAFLSDGAVQMHLAGRDLDLGFRSGNAINPVERGHIAFRTDDLVAFRKLLEDKGISYSDYGGVATDSWHQIFFHDPVGNVIEVHEISDSGAEAPDANDE